MGSPAAAVLLTGKRHGGTTSVPFKVQCLPPMHLRLHISTHRTLLCVPVVCSFPAIGWSILSAVVGWAWSGWRTIEISIGRSR
jgi:hypothetical protein